MLITAYYLTDTVFINSKKRHRVGSDLSCRNICQICILTDIKLSYLTFKSYSFFLCLGVFKFLHLWNIKFPVILMRNMLQRYSTLKIIKKSFYLQKKIESVFPDVISHIMHLQFATASPRATFPFVRKRKIIFVQTKQN